MSSNVEAFKKAKESIKQAQEQAKALAKDVFKELATHLFADNPELKGFQWTQYTPYFNDGDECVFSVNGDYPEIKYADSEEFLDKYDNVEAAKPLYEKVADFLGEFDDYDMKAMFGDHCEVKVSQDSHGTVDIDVEEYSHD